MSWKPSDSERAGTLVTLLHRRDDLRETMSAYLIPELDRVRVAMRDRSEIVELRGADGKVEAVTLKNGQRLQFSFLFLGALPCSQWLDRAVERDDNRYVLTGPAVNAQHLLETSVPGVFAAGDVRSGSTKRCASAVGEGAMAVQLVHEHLAGARARTPVSPCFRCPPAHRRTPHAPRLRAHGTRMRRSRTTAQ
jgi:thioredoxin reductase (NADPH)